MVRFNGEASIARERREAAREDNIIYARGGSGRKAQHGRRSPSGITDKVKISSDSVQIDISIEFETNMVSSYQL
jgi:hypothetical protein